MERNSFYEYAIDVLETNDFWRDDDNGGEPYNNDSLYDFSWATGASKVVIVLEDEVLKTSFKGYVECRDGEVNYFKENTDMCEIEFLVYEAAVKEGVQKFFARTERVAEGVYKQEKCVITCNELYCYGYADHPMKDMLSTLDIPRWGDERDYRAVLKRREFDSIGLYDLRKRVNHSEVLYFLAFNYDVEDLFRLLDFLNKYDINDIHGENVGVFADGTIKIFDFCGFESSTGSKFYD